MGKHPSTTNFQPNETSTVSSLNLSTVEILCQFCKEILINKSSATNLLQIIVLPQECYFAFWNNPKQICISNIVFPYIVPGARRSMEDIPLSNTMYYFPILIIEPVSEHSTMCLVSECPNWAR